MTWEERVLWALTVCFRLPVRVPAAEHHFCMLLLAVEASGR